LTNTGGYSILEESAMNQKYAETIIKRPSLYEALEVHGAREYFSDNETRAYCEIDDKDPDFYSVYIRYHDSPEVECIGDFASPIDANNYAKEISEKYGLNWTINSYPPHE
jgi:hypothetical protein